MKQRLVRFDNVKCLLIVLVVVGHLIDLGGVPQSHRLARALFIFIYSFHMPLFIFLTGLFLRRESMTGEKAAQRVTYFIMLGYLLKILYNVVSHLAGGSNLGFSLFTEAGLPWFMFALAAYYLLAWLLRGQDFAVIGAFALIIGLFVGYDSSIGDFLCLSRIIVYFPFFWLGHAMDAERLDDVLRRSSVRVACLVVLVLFVAACVLRTDKIYLYRALFTGRNSYANIGEWCSWANRLIAYLVSAAVCLAIMGVCSASKLPVVSAIGTRTLQVYAFHYELICVLSHMGLYSAVQSTRHGWLLLIPLGVVLVLLLSIKWVGYPLMAIEQRLKKGNEKG